MTVDILKRETARKLHQTITSGLQKYRPLTGNENVPRNAKGLEGSGRIIHQTCKKNISQDRWSWFISAGGRLFGEGEVRVDDFWEVAGADKADIDNELDALHEQT
ncbi:HRAS suppressor 3 [Biomphalaria glabrata]|nr:HRAS suppressor 3 [Biomphalaria glabrata]